MNLVNLIGIAKAGLMSPDGHEKHKSKQDIYLRYAKLTLELLYQLFGTNDTTMGKIAE